MSDRDMHRFAAFMVTMCAIAAVGFAVAGMWVATFSFACAALVWSMLAYYASSRWPR